jgi:hypothetical protein
MTILLFALLGLACAGVLVYAGLVLFARLNETREVEVCERLMDATYATVADGGGRAVRERRPAYHSQFRTKDGTGGGSPWGRGANMDEVIGSLVRCNPERFGITITYLEGKLPR